MSLNVSASSLFPSTRFKSSIATESPIPAQAKASKWVKNLSLTLKIATILGITLAGILAVAATIVCIVLVFNPLGAGFVATCGCVGLGIGATVAATVLFIQSHAAIGVLVCATVSGGCLVFGLITVSIFSLTAKQNHSPSNQDISDIEREESEDATAEDATSVDESSQTEPDDMDVNPLDSDTYDDDFSFDESD